MRERVLVRLVALLAASAVSAWSASRARAGDVLDPSACLVRGAGPAHVRLAREAGADRYDLGWMADRDLVGPRPYVVHIADAESPRAIIAHDRLVLPGLPADWVAAPRGADLVLCWRHAPAVVVIERQFCSAPVSSGDVVNGEIEEITFLGGVSYMADDLVAQFENGAVPAELAEDLRHEVAMASPAGHAHDPEAPQVIAYADEVATRVADWRVVPMSRALGAANGALGAATDAAAACHPRHADLRARINPANR